MQSCQQSNKQEMVLVTLELPRDVLEWIDGLKAQMGFQSRGLVVAELLRELIPDVDGESSD